MQIFHAARTRMMALALGLGAAGLGMAGCASVDNALFGDDASTSAPTPASQTEQQSQQAMSAPQPASDSDTAAAPSSDNAAAAPAAAGVQIAAVEQGSETGTPVGQTVQRIRGELTTLHDKAAADAQQYGTLKSAAAQNVTTYQEAKSHIIIRLQVGTTKGNPELVNEWNTSQSALDTLTGNINSFAALGTELSTDTSRAHTERNTIVDTFNMAGGVDEDHRQLTVLQQEADQMAGALDRMQSDTTRNVQQETAFVANERGGLTRLADAIKSGELYPTTPMATASLSPAASFSGSAKSILTIRFDKPKVAYEQDLYTALNQALQARPGATFSVVAVSPTGGSAAGMQKAQSEAQRHAQAVLKSMSDMGVPASRVSMSSSTDPSTSATEVLVYAK